MQDKNVLDLLDVDWENKGFSQVMETIEEAGFSFLEFHVEELLPVAVELDFGPMPEEDYATVHIFPTDEVVQSEERYQEFIELLENEKWQRAEELVAAFYVCAEKGEEEIFGFEDFGITLDEYKVLSHRSAEWVEQPGELQISF